MLAVGTVLLCTLAAAWQVQSSSKPSTVERLKRDVRLLASELPQPSPQGPHPKAVCDEATHEFGTMAANSSGRHVFTIRNEGEAPLKIKQGLKSCKCTKAEKKEEVIAPGGSCEIPVTWDMREIDENFSQVIHFHTNDPEEMTITLTVQGRVAPPVIVHPRNTWDLGAVDRENAEKFRGGIVSPLDDKLGKPEIKCSDPNVKFECTPMTAEELAEVWAKSGYWIDVTYEGTQGDGPFRVPFYISTGRDDVKVIACVVKGQRIGPIRVVPRGDVIWEPDNRVMDLGSFARAEGRTGVLHLFPARGKLRDFTILDAKTTVPGLKVTLTPGEKVDGAPPKFYELRIDVAPGSPPLSRTKADPGLLMLTTDHPDLPEWKLQIHAISN